MPVYKHSITGQEGVYSEEFVETFPEGTWEQVAEESEDEKRAREKEEAALAKVEVDDSDDKEGDAKAEAAKKGGTKK